jgi:molybdopterin-guanine dinucleotide biosynthesis protein A
MGKDKGLLPLNDSIWARIVGSQLELLNIPVVYSINKQQEETYRFHINKNLLISDLPSAEGPLTGLLSVYSKFPAHDFLLVACDMLDIRQTTLQLLLDEYFKGGDDFYAFHAGEFYEPLCAIYTELGLNKIFNPSGIIDSKNTSLQSILRNGQTRRLFSVTEESFNNYNSQSDINP